MSDIGVGIIGTGFMSWVHVEALRRVGGVAAVGIVGSTPEKSRAAAQKLGIPRAYASLQELLADPAVSAVHVNTPNRLHFPQTTAALAAGKHVLCEKPLAMDSRESAELVALAAKHPELVTAVNYNSRFYSLCHEARDMVRRGDVGRLFHITGSLSQDWLLHDTDYNWRVMTEEGGELRALSDIGSHWLDLIHFITGADIEAVFAETLTVHPTRHRPRGEVETFTNKLKTESDTVPVSVSTDDFSAVLLRFRGGARGCLWVSQVAAGRKCSLKFEIAGQKRTLAWDSENCERLWVGSRDTPNVDMMRVPPLMSAAAQRTTDYPAGHNEGYPDSFKHCFRSFYQYIAAGDFSAPRSFATFADGHRDIVLCDAFVESRQRGAWVNVS